MIKKFLHFLNGNKPDETTEKPRIEAKQVQSQVRSVPVIKNNSMNSSIVKIINRLSWIPSDTRIVIISEFQGTIDGVNGHHDMKDIFERNLNLDKATAYKLSRTIQAMVYTQTSYKDYIKSHCKGIEILGGYCDCKYCQALYGQKWPIKSPNLILPPYHIGCGCCISPVVDEEVSDPGPLDNEIYEHYNKFQHQFFKVSPECLRDKDIKEMLAILSSSIDQFNFDKDVKKELGATIKKLEKTMSTQRHNDGIIDECLTSIKNILSQMGENQTALKISAMIDEQLIY